MNNFMPITEKKFVKLTGVVGVECLKRRKTGSTWLLSNGDICIAFFTEKGWEYGMIKAS